MNAKIKRLHIDENKRIIVISDIHGNLDCFKRLLEKVGFNDDDELILLGDIMEKGPKLLETLQFTMHLSKQKNVHVLTGNCDEIWKFIRMNTFDDFFKRYFLKRKDNSFKEMCTEIGIELKDDIDINWLKIQIETHFHAMLDYLMQLPTIIETQRFTFVHAGIQNKPLEEQDHEFCVSTPQFMKSGLRFDKYIVVGHFPTSQYRLTKMCCNPIIDKESKIISIDGGNQVKDFGQLNALIIPNIHSDEFEYDYCDDSPLAFVQKAQIESTSSINIIWGDDQIIPFESLEDFTHCRHISSGRILWIPTETIYEKEGNFYCSNATDYMLGVDVGDIVSVVHRYSDRYLAKKNGTIGWIMGNPIYM
ncbi:MAG: metallophosphoesterase [Bacillales bacterium]|jgi:protein phosphatase|nr:metallophosphoesterase [Bacillales bacterium]